MDVADIHKQLRCVLSYGPNIYQVVDVTHQFAKALGNVFAGVYMCVSICHKISLVRRFITA
jgi:hypothetical protein